MTNVKKLLRDVKPRIIKNQAGKVVDLCIDIKMYQAMLKAIQEWGLVQKKEGTRWVRVSGR